MLREVKSGDNLSWLAKGLAALADQGLVASSGFLLTILMGRWLPPQQYGAYALAFSLFLFLARFHQALLLEPMNVFGPGVFRNHLPEYLGELIRLHIALSLMLSLLIGAAGALVGRVWHHPALASALWGASLGIPSILFFWLWRRAAYLRPRPGATLPAAGAYALTLLGLLLLFKRMGWLSAFTPFLLQMIAAVIAGGLLVYRIRPGIHTLCQKARLRVVLERHWEYGRWAAATAVVAWIANGAYYVILGAFLRMEDAAGLRALQNISVPLPQFVTAMSLFLLPHFSATFGREGAAVFRHTTRKMILLLAGCGVAYMLGVLFSGQWLFGRLYGGRYAELAHFLPLLAAPIPLMAASEGLAIALRAMQAPAEVFKGYLAASMMTLLAGIPLVRLRGIGGALLCILLSYLTFALVLLSRYRAKLKESAALGAIAITATRHPDNARVGFPVLGPSVRKEEFSG